MTSSSVDSLLQLHETHVPSGETALRAEMRSNFQNTRSE